MEEELDLLELFYAFKKRILWLILAIIWGAMIGFIYTKYIVEPEYTSFVKLILAKPVYETGNIGNMNDMGITQSDIQLNQKLIATYGEIMKSRKISNTVIDNLELDMTYEEIIKCIDVSSVKDTDMIKLSITTTDPSLSAMIAMEMTSVFTKEIVNIYSIQNISIIDTAEIDNDPVNVNYIKNIAIFAIIALVLVSGVIFIMYYFDNTIKTEEDIEKLTGLPVLCMIPKVTEEKGGKKND